MIEVRHLTKNYGTKTALDDVSFTVNEGEVAGLLGPNGAGKSTTMNIITGNLSASSGSVCVGGFDILEEPMEAKKRLGYLPELPPLYPDMTVTQYLKFVYELKKCRLPREEHLSGVLTAAHIEDVKSRVIKNLSKGYRQRIGIAQALIGDPKVLILDEPTVGLDPKQLLEMRELIRAQVKHRTVILSSHILSEVQATCTRVLVLDHGRLIADDTPKELARRLSGGTLFIRLIGPRHEAQRILKETPGILSFTEKHADDPDQCAFRIRCEEAEELRVRLAGAFRASVCLPVEISGADMSLENIFLTLTKQEGEAQ